MLSFGERRVRPDNQDHLNKVFCQASRLRDRTDLTKSVRGRARSCFAGSGSKSCRAHGYNRIKQHRTGRRLLHDHAVRYLDCKSP